MKLMVIVFIIIISPSLPVIQVEEKIMAFEIKVRKQWENGEAYVVRNCKICTVECQMFLYLVNHGQWPACCRRWGMIYTKTFCLKNVNIGENLADFAVGGSMLMISILEK
jgi:hypothetical protein